MKADEIKTSEDLERWILALSEDRHLPAARVIKSRAALRALPVWAQYAARSGKTDLIAIPVFWSILLSVPVNIKLSSDTARSAAVGATAHTASAAFAARAAFAAAAADAAAFAARAASVSDVAAFAARAASASAADAASFAYARVVADVAISTDAASFEKGRDVLRLPLWPDGADPLADAWATSADMRQNHPGWSVFTDLYENALHGRPQNWPLLTELAEKDEAFWTGPDNEVLDRIAAVLEERALEKSFNAERIEINAATGLLRAVPTSELSSDQLLAMRDKLSEAVRIFDGQGGENGPYRDLMPEIAIVQRALDHNDLSPIRIYDACRRASRRTRSKVAQAMCPDDELVEDFLAQIDEAAFDLAGYNDDVRKVVENRVRLRPEADIEKVQEILPPAIEEIASVSEPEFAVEQIEDAKLIASPDVSADQKKEAIGRSGGRILRAYQASKSALKEASEISECSAKIIKNSGIIYAAYQVILMWF